MAIQLSVPVRNARLDAIETTIGTAAKLQIWTGSPPANCAATDTGTQLAELTLPSDWLAAASAGAKVLTGSWTGTGIAAGNAGHFRIKDNAETACHMQGTITAEGGGGDMTLDAIAIAVDQAISVLTFTLTDANA